MILRITAFSTILVTAITTGAIADMSLADKLAADDRAVPYYTGKIYPIPQDATYHDFFIPLGNAGILPGKGIKASDARLALLGERITRYGGKAEIVELPDSSFDTLFLIGETGLYSELLGGHAAPEREEGYLIHVVKHDDKNIVFLKGHDFHGLLWAITAFNQLVKLGSDGAVARGATVMDFPDAPGRRAYTPFYDDDDATLAWFGVNVLRSKLIQYRQIRMLYRQMPRPWDKIDWRMPLRDDEIFGSWQKRIQKIGSVLNPLQIPWCDAIQPLSSVRTEDLVRSKSEEDIELLIKVGAALAEAGGHLMIMYDDFRFPIHPDDVRDFGTAREADVYFLNRVYSAVAAKYPDFKIIFCPPFYWGASGRDNIETYGESRDKYLKAIGEGLPDGIEIFWTGPRVKSTIVTSDDVEWITGLLKRKPVFWQNACGVFRASVYYAYPALDPMRAWKDWYYDGFFNDLKYYTYNGEYPYITLTLHDAMWNTGAYEPVSSGEEAAKKLVGLDVYPKMLAAYRQLEKLDDYGWFTPTALAARNIDKVRAETEKLVALFDAAPPQLKSRWMQLPQFVGWKQRYLVSLMKNPQLEQLAEIDETVRNLAVKETGLGSEVPGIILVPNEFRAGRSPSYYAWENAERRHVIWINGARSSAPAMEAGFHLAYPLEGSSVMTIAALDHNAEPPCRIRILMNGNVVFEGENPFKSDKWTKYDFEVKGAFLRDGVLNTLRVENLEDSDVMTGAPWFMISYVVIRPAK